MSPETSEDSKAPVFAAEAKALRCRGWAAHDRQAAFCAFRARDDLEIIVENDFVWN